MRPRSVRAAPFERDVEKVTGSLYRASLNTDLSFREDRRSVSAVNFERLIFFQHAGGNNASGASADFFGRLKDSQNSAGKIRMRMKCAYRSQEPSHMSVMAAGMTTL